jgi:hypothetical protein
VEKNCVLILTKMWLGCILGDIFKNSSGHPGPKASFLKQIFEPVEKFVGISPVGS